MSFTNMVRWLPYGLFPSDPEGGRPQPEILELRLPAGVPDWLTAFREETVETVQEWSLDAVLKNFALRAAVWHVNAQEYKTGKRRADTTIQELREWTATTRSLAARLPFRGPVSALMTQAADRMQHDLDWPARFFTRWPKSVLTMQDAQWRVSLNLWAADYLVRAVNAIEPLYAEMRTEASGEPREHVSIPPTKLWPAMFDWLPETRSEPAFSDYNEAQKRVRSIDQTIKPELKEALMTELLGDVLHTGHFGPSEQPRAPLIN